MVDITFLVALCEKALLKGGSKLVELYRQKKFSKKEGDLLLAAAKRGEFHLLSVEEIPGSWIRANGRNFLNENDPAFAVKYLEAFQSLCERGYITHESGTFMLTSSGFERARKLADKN